MDLAIQTTYLGDSYSVIVSSARKDAISRACERKPEHVEANGHIAD
jgi:hypothetical protein